MNDFVYEYEKCDICGGELDICELGAGVLSLKICGRKDKNVVMCRVCYNNIKDVVNRRKKHFRKQGAVK